MNDNSPPNIFPALRYRDAEAALAWLCEVFGFEEKSVYRGDDGVIHHAELRLGAGLVMFGQHGDEGSTGEPAPGAPPAVSIYVVIDDPDAHYARAVAAGATILRELTDQPYGSREYGARDIEGNHWSFGTYDPYASE